MRGAGKVAPLKSMRMSNIKGDFERVKYTRAKTSRKFDVVIAGRSTEILRYYASGKEMGSDELVFHIMPEEIIGLGKKEVTLYESRRKVFNQNLKKIALNQLQELGVLEKNIEISPLCTYENSHDFFSYRKEKMTGRLGTFIYKQSPS